MVACDTYKLTIQHTTKIPTSRRSGIFYSLAFKWVKGAATKLIWNTQSPIAVNPTAQQQAI
jgi:hypothetical protein